MWGVWRGTGVVVLTVCAIAWSWQEIESRPVQEASPAELEVTNEPTATTTTTASPTPSTTSLESVLEPTCQLAQTFVDEAAKESDDHNTGPVAQLAATFWTALAQAGPEYVEAELNAVADYYANYLAIAEPFDFDPKTIIANGDKEKLEQLLTRPAPGLEESHNMIIFFCGFEVPGQPTMDATAFADLESLTLRPNPSR
jgi:hypothetical protein